MSVPQTVPETVVERQPLTAVGGVLRRARTDLPRPPAMRGQPYVWLAVFLAGVALFRQFGVSGFGDGDLYNTWIFYSIIVVGFYYVFGISGQFAFSQAIMAGVGGYTSAWATRVELLGTDFWLAGLVVAIVVTAILAFLFSLLMRKATAFYFAIGTLGLSAILLEVFVQWTDFTNSAGDATRDIVGIRLFGLQFSGNVIKASKLSPKGIPVPVEPGAVSYRVFWVLLAVLAIAMLFAIFLARSPVQREAIAGRDHSLVASTVGVPVFRLRVTMFVLGSVAAGAAGSLFVHWKTFASPDSFAIDLGLGIFVMLLFGGLDSRWGPVIGAFFYVFIPQWLQGGVLGIPGPHFTVKLAGQVHNASDFKNIIYGALLVVIMIAFPEGLVGIGRRLRALTFGGIRPERRTWLSDLFGLTPKKAAAASGDAPRPEIRVADLHVEPGLGLDEAAPLSDSVPLMEADEIAVQFGGVRAVDGVSLTLFENEILGLVGPNGSGKTTFLNALNGVVPATGSFRVRGEPITLGKPGRARGHRVLRTFQAPQTYEYLSCIEDVLLSTPQRSYTGITTAWFARPWMLAREHERWEAAAEALDLVGLVHLAEEPTTRLSYGQRRLLELARAIAARPRVLMLDEPSAGLNASETEQLAGFLRQLREGGVSILLVDHKLDFITSLCDRVAVLELGHLVAVGPASTVFNDQRVVDAYLGVDEEDRPAVMDEGAPTDA